MPPLDPHPVKTWLAYAGRSPSLQHLVGAVVRRSEERTLGAVRALLLLLLQHCKNDSRARKHWG